MSGWAQFWAGLGSAAGLSLAFLARRLVNWYLPPGHHSKRVRRYGVRDIELPLEEEDE